MAIRTQQSLSGFIASQAELTTIRNGESRLSVRVGQEHFLRNDDGSFIQIEPTFRTLVQYRRAAERSYEAFQKGDHFVAEGYVREYDYDFDGQTQHGEEFVAKKIGHDVARQRYTVNRTTPVAGSADLGHSPVVGATADQPPAQKNEVSEPGAVSDPAAHTATRRDQLADIVLDRTDASTQLRSTPLAL